MNPENQEPLSKPDIVRLRHMYDACKRAIEIAQGVRVETLDPSSETALALTRLLEILGEASKHVTPATQQLVPEIPWRLIAGLRNRIIHEYFNVDFEIVASVIGNDLPELEAHLAHILMGR